MFTNWVGLLADDRARPVDEEQCYSCVRQQARHGGTLRTEPHMYQTCFREDNLCKLLVVGRLARE